MTKPRGSPTLGPQRTPGSPLRASTVAPYPAIPLQRPRTGLASPPSSTGAQRKDFSAFRPVSGAALGYNSVFQSPNVTPMEPTPTEDRRTSPSASYASPESSMSFRDSKVGFLGPTSYSAVLTEHSGSLGICDQEDVDHAPNLPPVSAEKIQQGAEILALLRDMPVYEKFIQRFFEFCDGIVILQPVYRVWIDELWSEFGKLLIDGKPEQLRSLSELVWRNTRRSMKVHGKMTAREWATSASGRNLRWEVVGVILSMAGLIAVNLSNWDVRILSKIMFDGNLLILLARQDNIRHDPRAIH